MDLDDIYEKLKNISPVIAQEYLLAVSKNKAFQDILNRIRELLKVAPGESIIEAVKLLSKEPEPEPAPVPKPTRVRSGPTIPKEDREELLNKAADLGIVCSNKDSSKRLLRLIQRAERKNSCQRPSVLSEDINDSCAKNSVTGW